ncbi:hypothetical protein LSM04_003840 [Trypanosoma melophagium]|uniref:uncharacterized protein n=1 Tax=Trypanosoma melophagium TaxID=715481 RepID=UPI003519FB1F|nr:hypothetical protein LSM04_003840 [Trypanosoma melophagium]
MGSQALPAAPPSVANISCVLVEPVLWGPGRECRKLARVFTPKAQRGIAFFSFLPLPFLLLLLALPSTLPVVALPRHGCVNHTSGVESAAQRSPAFRVHPLPVAQVLANGGDSSNGSKAKSMMLEEMLRDFRERLRHPRPAMHCL